MDTQKILLKGRRTLSSGEGEARKKTSHQVQFNASSAWDLVRPSNWQRMETTLTFELVASTLSDFVNSRVIFLVEVFLPHDTNIQPKRVGVFNWFVHYSILSI